MAAEYTSEQLASMPLEDLEALVMQESENLSSLLATGSAETLPASPMPEELGAMPSEPTALIEEELPDISAPAIMDPEVPLDMLSPDIIQSATSALVESGFLDQATNQMSPDLIQVFQGVADIQSPGIYNLSNDADLMEFVNGIANGIIPLSGAAGSAAPIIPSSTSNPRILIMIQAENLLMLQKLSVLRSQGKTLRLKPQKVSRSCWLTPMRQKLIERKKHLKPPRLR